MPWSMVRGYCSCQRVMRGMPHVPSGPNRSITRARLAPSYLSGLLVGISFGAGESAALIMAIAIAIEMCLV